MTEETTTHTPVLLQEVIQMLEIHHNDVVVDATAGGGGHAEAILACLGSEGKYVGIDVDTSALDRVRSRIGTDSRVMLVEGNFRDLHTLTHHVGVHSCDKILADLGVSSDQLTGEGASDRGFSFERDAPLRMTLASHPLPDATTAEIVVNEWSEESLADILYGFGGERSARKIAHAIVTARAESPIRTTVQLASIVESVVKRRGRTHPATRTFQAIRIAVNDETGALTDLLTQSLALLAPGGRLAIISFHSLEDGIVKRMFRAWHTAHLGTILTKKPIIPHVEESTRNRRSRSAKLRVFLKAPV